MNQCACTILYCRTDVYVKNTKDAMGFMEDKYKKNKLYQVDRYFSDFFIIK